MSLESALFKILVKLGLLANILELEFLELLSIAWRDALKRLPTPWSLWRLLLEAAA